MAVDQARLDAAKTKVAEMILMNEGNIELATELALLLAAGAAGIIDVEVTGSGDSGDWKFRDAPAETLEIMKSLGIDPETFTNYADHYVESGPFGFDNEGCEGAVQFDLDECVVRTVCTYGEYEEREDEDEEADDGELVFPADKAQTEVMWEFDHLRCEPAAQKG